MDIGGSGQNHLSFRAIPVSSAIRIVVVTRCTAV